MMGPMGESYPTIFTTDSFFSELLAHRSNINGYRGVERPP